MAIVFPLASPAQFGIAGVQWAPMNNTARAKAPFTLRDAVQVFDGAMWTGVLTIRPHVGATGRGLSAWLTSLQGRRGTFLLGDPAADVPLGSAATTPGTPVVDGAGQTGSAVDLRGLPVSATGYLLAGDYLQIGSAATARLHMALEDVDSDGGGLATATIWPSLRSSPADGAGVVVSGAEGVFALTTGAPGWSERPAPIHDGVSLPVEEVVT